MSPPRRSASAAPAPTTGWVTTDDGRLRFERWSGAGPAIVLLHSARSSRREWARIAVALAAFGWEVVTYDARSHGDSDRTPDASYEAQRRDLGVLIDRLELDEPLLVGSSMGGAVALEHVAAGHASAALLLLDAPCPLERLAGLQTPTRVVVAGGRVGDERGTRRASERVAAIEGLANPWIEVVVVPTSHVVALEAPAFVVEQVRILSGR